MAAWKLHTCLGRSSANRLPLIFLQDGCKLHILVWGISEQQHRDIASVRDNIFDLQRYLQRAQIAHAVAHPLYSVNGKLEASHLEQLILLFKHFEGINGLRDALLSDLAQTLFKQLTPEKIEALANRHGLAPTHAEPWRKSWSAGPTIMADSSSPQLLQKRLLRILPNNFSKFVRNGDCSACGQGGTPLILSHGFYNTVACFIQDRFHEKLGPGGGAAGENVLAFHGGPCPDRVHAQGENGIHRARRVVGKNL